MKLLFLMVPAVLAFSSSASAFGTSCRAVCQSAPNRGDSKTVAEFAYAISICKKSSQLSMVVHTLEGDETIPAEGKLQDRNEIYSASQSGLKFVLQFKMTESPGTVGSKLTIESDDGWPVESSTFVCTLK